MAPAELGGRLHSAQIGLVIGTRPEAIKLAPVAHALERRGLAAFLIFTGQQRLLAEDLGLSGFPALGLGCPGQTDPDAHVRMVADRLLSFLRDPPALLLVQGDTSSALGGAIAGLTAGIAVGHVEAGLRTHDLSLPWPEEGYRTAIDARAELLFAPTAIAAANLRKEQVGGVIHVTGNSGIDALLEAEATLLPRTPGDGGAPRLLVTCHRRESWGAGLKGIAVALATLASSGAARIEFVLHPNPHVASTMRQALGDVPGISLVEPLGHRDLLIRMRAADLILSDSGGIQEEAPALGTPLLVLRDKTERPEGIVSGNMRLVGTDRDRIVAEVRRLLDDPAALAAMARPALPYGDGRAAPRIAAIVEDWLERRGSMSPEPPAVSPTAGPW